MCILTLATAWRYSSIIEQTRGTKVYSFLLETDREGMSRIESDLKESICSGVEGEEVADGLYRITLRCPPEKFDAVWGVIKRPRRSPE